MAVLWFYEDCVATYVNSEIFRPSLDESGQPGSIPLVMRILLAGIVPSSHRLRGDPAFAVTSAYLERAAQYCPCVFEEFPDETALLRKLDRRSGRTPAALLLLDGTGKRLNSQQFAQQLGGLRDTGRQQAVFAIGPADGWAPTTRARADLLLSLGPMTLPHALAQAVLAEQIYRALTILAGHPYHCGH